MVLAIIQARMGSSRLPGKIMKLIKNKPILLHVYDRVAKSKNIDKIVVATSTNIENNIIGKLCHENNILCYRGNENDVLDRYYKCAKLFNDDIIIRITSDCPLIDFLLIDEMILFYKKNRCLENHKYLKNTWFKNAYPSGFDIEIFSYDLLKNHWENEKNLSKREHVLSSYPYYYKYNCNKKYKIDINLLHLSVDTIKDFNLVKHIIENLNNDYNFDDVMKFLENSNIWKSNLDNEMLNKIKLIKKI